MDEPTSGLDAINALRVVSTMRQLCRKGNPLVFNSSFPLSGHTIITTIHQPRSDIFRMFDYLLLLVDGKTAFYGHAQYAVQYFSRFSIELFNH